MIEWSESDVLLNFISITVRSLHPINEHLFKLKCYPNFRGGGYGETVMAQNFISQPFPKWHFDVEKWRMPSPDGFASKHIPICLSYLCSNIKMAARERPSLWDTSMKRRNVSKGNIGNSNRFLSEYSPGSWTEY